MATLALSHLSHVVLGWAFTTFARGRDIFQEICAVAPRNNRP
jgi:hypothetical protein